MDKNNENKMLNIQLINPNAGICDCNDEKCVGCFWPCEICSSTKCGHQCRINRDWKYEVWERQGRKQT